MGKHHLTWQRYFPCQPLSTTHGGAKTLWEWSICHICDLSSAALPRPSYSGGEWILRVLGAVNNNVERAAEVLKIDRATIYRKIKKYSEGR